MRCWWRPKDKVQDVKKLVARIKAGQGAARHLLHREVHSGPGAATTASMPGTGFQVKRLTVKPGACDVTAARIITSRRSTGSWCRGTARITRNSEVFELLEENQSARTFPMGAKHRIENPGTEDHAAH